jgi:SNF2 family DNA or RNA helicase
MHSPSHNVLLATQLKAAESITLTNCRYAIYYSNTWSQDKRSNSEARIYRKGSEKHKNIIYIDLVVKDSVEEAVYECLKRKKSLVATLMKQFAIL